MRFFASLIILSTDILYQLSFNHTLSFMRLCIFKSMFSLFYNICTVGVDQVLPADENGSGFCVSSIIRKKLYWNFNQSHKRCSLRGT